MGERRCSRRPPTGSSDRARARPLLITIDDLQWADESSLRLGSFLVAAAAGLRMVLAFGVRDESAEMSAPLRDLLATLPADVVRLPLSGLDVSATGELLRGVLDYEPSLAMVEELHARTGGNPLFVEECARLVTEQGRSTTVVVPDRVRQVITRRLARLPKRLHLLAAASVTDDFDLDLLAAVIDMPVADVAAASTTLEARLVVEDEDGYRFARADPPDAARHPTRRATHRAAPADRDLARGAPRRRGPRCAHRARRTSSCALGSGARRRPPAGGAPRGRRGEERRRPVRLRSRRPPLPVGSRSRR